MFLFRGLRVKAPPGVIWDLRLVFLFSGFILLCVHCGSCGGDEVVLGVWCRGCKAPVERQVPGCWNCGSGPGRDRDHEMLLFVAMSCHC